MEESAENVSRLRQLFTNHSFSIPERWKQYLLSTSQTITTHTQNLWQKTIRTVSYLFESIKNYVQSFLRRRWYTSLDDSEEDYLCSGQEKSYRSQESADVTHGYYYQNIKEDIEQSELFSKFKPCTEKQIEDSQQSNNTSNTSSKEEDDSESSKKSEDCLIDFSNPLEDTKIQENNDSQELFYSCPDVL